MAASCGPACTVDYGEQASRARTFWAERDRPKPPVAKTHLPSALQGKFRNTKRLTRMHSPPKPRGSLPLLKIVPGCNFWPEGPAPERPVRRVGTGGQRVPDDQHNLMERQSERLNVRPRTCAWPTAPAPSRAVVRQPKGTRGKWCEEPGPGGDIGKAILTTTTDMETCCSMGNYIDDWDYRELTNDIGRLQRLSLPATTKLTTPSARTAKDYPLTNNDLRQHYWDAFQNELTDTIAEFKDHPAVQSMLQAAASAT